jgi:response regulator NasT
LRLNAHPVICSSQNRRYPAVVTADQERQLRVLVANEDTERVDSIAEVVHQLGHTVAARVTEIAKVADATVEAHPDVALVGLGAHASHALALIGEIVGESECPVVAVLPGVDNEFVAEAASRGIFAYVADADLDALRNSLQIVLLRFAEYHGLEGAFERRAVIERAKGILMERHGIAEGAAFEALRGHARKNQRRVVDVAQDVLAGGVLIPPA